MKKMIAAWVAGIIEGEGHICGRTNDYKGRQGVTVHIQIQVNMTDEDVIRLCQKRTGLGRVGGPYYNKKKPHHKPTWKWTIGKAKEVNQLLIAIMPWLGERRRTKIMDVLKARRESIELRNQTRMANGKQKTDCCSHGHLFTPENTHWQRSKKSVYRRCRSCGRAAYHRNKPC